MAKEMGLLHLYVGSGKGKTTAAAGLALRAAGRGCRVLFVQFMKGGKSGEIEMLKQLPGVQVLRSDKAFPFYKQMTQEQKQAMTEIHNAMLAQIAQALETHAYDMIVLDEITYPCRYALIQEELLKMLVERAAGAVELVCTGRNPMPWLLERADYVTNMEAVRHPYEKGVEAREGIEY